MLAVQDPPSPLDITTARDSYHSRIDEAQRTAVRSAAKLSKRLGTIEVRVVRGDARQAIVDVAAEWDADLVVVGARGLGAISGALLGSVSLAVARHAPCPVLVVRATGRPVHSIVIAFDGSHGARRAARFVARLPLPTETGVRLVGVVERPRIRTAAPAATAALVSAAAKITAARQAALETAMDKIAVELDGLKVTRDISVGSPAESLTRLNADLIVVGARGLCAVKRLLLGSVSERVLRYADCPVLIVRGGLKGRLARRRQHRSKSAVSA